MISLNNDLTIAIELSFEIGEEFNTLKLDPWDLILCSDRALIESIFR